MENLSLDHFSSCFQTLTIVDNYHQKRWFCTFFAFTAQNVLKHIQNAVLFTKTNVTQDCKYNSKRVKIVKHTAKKAKKNESYEIGVSWGRFQYIYQIKNFSPKSLFLHVFCFFVKNMSKRMQTTVIWTESNIQDSGSIFQRYEEKSSSMNRNDVLDYFLPLEQKTP